MDIDEIAAYVEGLGGVLTLRPGPGDGTPEIAWGDLFFYYAPDGVVPQTQPFATVVTKDYPGDTASRLDRDGAFRVNIAAGTAEFRRRTGQDPQEAVAVGHPADDAVTVHPDYGSLGWLAVTNPGSVTDDAVRELLRLAHDHARARWQRRRGTGGSDRTPA